MVEVEYVISHLRSQVGNLQSLLDYLESCEMVGREEYSYLHTKLREVIGRLKEMERFSSQHGQLHSLRAQRLN